MSDAHGIAFEPREIELKIEVDAARRARSVEGITARRAWHAVVGVDEPRKARLLNGKQGRLG